MNSSRKEIVVAADKKLASFIAGLNWERGVGGSTEYASIRYTANMRRWLFGLHLSYARMNSQGDTTLLLHDFSRSAMYEITFPAYESGRLGFAKFPLTQELNSRAKGEAVS